MQELMATDSRHNIVIEVGGVPVRVRTADGEFVKLLERRYAGFVGAGQRADFDFETDLAAPDASGEG